MSAPEHPLFCVENIYQAYRQCRRRKRNTYDDLVLLSAQKPQLEAWEQQIAGFLNERLHLRLNERRKLRPVSDSIDFLGSIVRADYLLVRRRVVGALRDRLDKAEQELRRPWLRRHHERHQSNTSVSTITTSTMFYPPFTLSLWKGFGNPFHSFPKSFQCYALLYDFFFFRNYSARETRETHEKIGEKEENFCPFLCLL